MWNKPSNHPEYYKKILLLVEEHFLDYPALDVTYIVEGYYHADNVYCDYTGQTIYEKEEPLAQETIIAWMDKPELPTKEELI